jgi:hypothetical protein
MTNVLITIAPNGHLSRRTRGFIMYAPVELRITVKRMNDKIAGYSIDSPIIDDPLAELTGGKDD